MRINEWIRIPHPLTPSPLRGGMGRGIRSHWYIRTHSYIGMTGRSGGQALFIAAIFFLIISTTVVLGVVTPVLNDTVSARAVLRGTQALYAAEGVSQDVAYRLQNNMTVDTAETISFGGYRATATTTSVFDGKEIVAEGVRDGFTRRNHVHLSEGTGVSFPYGTEVGNGGLILENNSSVAGSVYSNGPVIGSESNLIKGDVLSAGPQGKIDGVHATSSAYAHTIQNSTIDKDAHYQVLSNTTVLGTLHPGSPDQSATTLPISDSQVAQWESDAEAGGVISSPCPYEIESDITIGPKKIACDLEVSGSPTVTLKGALWVTGNILIKNTATIHVDSSLGAKSVPVIADTPSNQTTSSKITLENSVVFQGSGSSTSFVLMLSQNKSAEQGGGEKAIEVKNSVSGALLVYAGHGEIQLQNNIKVKEVSAYRIRLKNSAEVRYETGLANLIFTAGPGGGYVFDRWREVE